MASTYSTNLAIELIGTGDQAGSWGNTTNTNLGTLIEQAISGYVTQAVSTGTDTTITIPNGATGVARNMYIELTGTGGTNTNLIVPANKKLYFIFNNSTGAVTVKVSGQTGVSVPQGKKMVLVSNGTDVVVAENYIADFGSNSATITNLTCTSLTLSNNPTFSGGTANGVLYLNGSKVATSGSALTFDGNGLNVTKTTATFGVPVYQFNAGAVNGIFTGDTTLSTVSLGSYSNHALAFYTNNTLRATLDTSGNLGLGVTPFGWNSSYKAFDLGSGALMGRASNTDTYLLSNAYLGASTFQYKYTAAASYYSQAAGVHYWWNAPSGTAGNTISFTQAMTLNSSGFLGVGATSQPSRITIEGTNGAVGSQIQLVGTGVLSGYIGPSADGLNFGTDSGGLLFRTGVTGNGSVTTGTERMRLDSSGNLGLGTLPTYPTRFNITNNSVSLSTNNFITIQNLGLNTSDNTNSYPIGGLLFSGYRDVRNPSNVAGIWAERSPASGGAASGGALIFGAQVNGENISQDSSLPAEVARITAGGLFGVGTTSPDFKLDVISNTTYQLRLATADDQNYVSGGLYLGASGTSDPYYYGYMRWDQTDISLKIGSQHGNSTGGILFLTGVGSGAQTEKARITNGGSFKIGASNAGGTMLGISDGTTDGTSYGSVQVTKVVDHDNKWHYACVQAGQEIGGMGFQDNVNQMFVVGRGADPGSTNSIRFAGSDSSTRFLNNGSERARIDQYGNFGLNQNGTATNKGIFMLLEGYTSASRIGICHENGVTSGNKYTEFYYNSNLIGSIEQDGTTAVKYNTTSDRRLKDNIVPAPSASNIIDSIQIVSHNWKSAPDEHVTYGFIAQELYKVAPQAVSVGDDGDTVEKPWGVDYSKLVPMLVKELQSVRARLAALEAK